MFPVQKSDLSFCLLRLKTKQASRVLSFSYQHTAVAGTRKHSVAAPTGATPLVASCSRRLDWQSRASVPSACNRPHQSEPSCLSTPIQLHWPCVLVISLLSNVSPWEFSSFWPHWYGLRVRPLDHSSLGKLHKSNRGNFTKMTELKRSFSLLE